MMLAQNQYFKDHGQQLSDESLQNKKQAAQFLAQQTHQIYEDRRGLLIERDSLIKQNANLQRLNIELKCDLEQY